MPSVYAGLVHTRRQHTGDAGSAGVGLAEQLFTQGQDPGQYVLDTASTDIGVDPAKVAQISQDIQDGDYGAAATHVDALILSTLGTPIAGALFEGLVAGMSALFYGPTPPCTVPGCESVIANTRPCPSALYTVYADPNVAGSSLDSYDEAAVKNYGLATSYGTCPDGTWGCFSAGEFEDALNQVLIDAYNKQISAPVACGLLQKNVDLKLWGQQYLGTLLPAFVAAWNKAHPHSVGNWNGPPGPQVGLQWEYGKPYTVTRNVYGAAGISQDMIATAFAGLARAAGLPINKNTTVSVIVARKAPQPYAPPSTAPSNPTNFIPAGASLIPAGAAPNKPPPASPHLYPSATGLHLGMSPATLLRPSARPASPPASPVGLTTLAATGFALAIGMPWLALGLLLGGGAGALTLRYV